MHAHNRIQRSDTFRIHIENRLVEHGNRIVFDRMAKHVGSVEMVSRTILRGERGRHAVDYGQIGALRLVDVRARIGEEHGEAVCRVRERNAARYVHGNLAFFGVYRHDGKVAHACGQLLHIAG